jgi:hypothetical protein
MAFFYFKCPRHGRFTAVLARRQAAAPCPKCMSMAAAVLGVPGATTMETLDNGAMARKVTRMHDVEELLDDVAEKDSARFHKNHEEDDD